MQNINDNKRESYWNSQWNIGKNIINLTPVVALSKTIEYSGGKVSLVSDVNGTKSFTYSWGKLISITGTGIYPSKTLVYTSGILTWIIVL